MESEKSKILFDGNCIVCDYEINHYKRISPDKFEIIDISEPEFQASSYGVTPEAVQKHMHVITPKGQLVRGVDAFTHIWSRIPKYKWAEKIVRFPLIYPFARLGYEIFARNRHLLPKKNRL